MAKKPFVEPRDILCCETLGAIGNPWILGKFPVAEQPFLVTLQLDEATEAVEAPDRKEAPRIDPLWLDLDTETVELAGLYEWREVVESWKKSLAALVANLRNDNSARKSRG